MEIYERDPLTLIEGADTRVCRPEVPAAVRTMRASVPNLEEARDAFVDAMGLQVVEKFQLRSGAPFRAHQGDIFVTEDGRGRSRVRWAIRFDCWIPFTGKLVAWLLEQVFKRDLHKLKSRLEAYGAGDRF